MATTKTTSATAELDKAFEPVRAFNQLTLEKAAQLVEMNIEAMRRYTDLALANARELVDLRDPAALQAYFAKQPEAIKAFTETAKADAEAAVKLGLAYVEEAGQLVAKGANGAAKKAS